MAVAKAYQAQRLKIDGAHRKVLPASEMQATVAHRSLSGKQYVLIMLNLDNGAGREHWYGYEASANEARQLATELLEMADALEAEAQHADR